MIDGFLVWRSGLIPYSICRLVGRGVEGVMRMAMADFILFYLVLWLMF
jgi:hypothetical protein